MGSLSNLSVLETRFYNIFQKYYKGIHRKVVEVQVEGFSTEDETSPQGSNPQKYPECTVATLLKYVLAFV